MVVAADVGEEAQVTPLRLRADVEAAEVRSSWPPSVVGSVATKRPLLRERSRIEEEDEAM